MAVGESQWQVALFDLVSMQVSKMGALALCGLQLQAGNSQAVSWDPGDLYSSGDQGLQALLSGPSQPLSAHYSFALQLLLPAMAILVLFSSHIHCREPLLDSGMPASLRAAFKSHCLGASQELGALPRSLRSRHL